MPDLTSLRAGLDEADPSDLELRRELADILNEQHPASRDSRADGRCPRRRVDRDVRTALGQLAEPDW